MVTKRRKFVPGITGTYDVAHRVMTQLSKGPLTLGGIRNFIKELGVKITKDAVIKFLKKYEQKGMIKKEYRGSKFPVYYLSKKGLQDVGLMANTFRHRAIAYSLNRLSVVEGKEKQLLKKIVDIIGLYSFTAYLYGDNFDGKPQQFAEKNQLWLDNIAIPPEVIGWLDGIMMTFWNESQKKVLTPIVSSYGPTIMKWDEEEISISKQVAKKVRKMLYTLYPKEMKAFDDIYQELDEAVKDYNELVKRSKNSS